MLRTLVLLSLFLVLVATSPAEAKAKSPPVSVSNLSLKVEQMPIGKNKGKRFVTITFDATTNSKISKGQYLHTKAKCLVGEKTYVDESSSFEGLEDLEAGETTQIETTPFINKELASAPASCEIQVMLGELFGGRGRRKVGTYCWRGKEVKEGACPKE